MHALGRVALSVLAGWTTLLSSEFVLQYGILRGLNALGLGAVLPALQVVFDLAALAAGGFVAGRLARTRRWLAVWLLALSLAPWDLAPLIPLNLPWLVRLIANATQDPRYAEGLPTALITQALLFASLFWGAQASRPREIVPSLSA